MDIRQSAVQAKKRLPAMLGVLVGFSVIGAGLVYRMGIAGMLLAVVLLATFSVVLTKPDRATVIGIFAVYANLGAMFLHYHHASPMVASTFFAVLAFPFVVPLTYYVIVCREDILIDAPLYLMVLYFAVLLASVFVAVDPTQSTGKIISYGLEGVALYFLVLNTVRTPAILRKAVLTLLVAGVVMGSLSVFQAATHTYSSSYGGLAQVQKQGVSTGDSDPGEERSPGRVAGPVGETNRYAQVMVVLLPLGIFQAFSERKRRNRILVAAACIPILMAVLLTFSRGAGVALVIALIAMTVYGHIRLKHFALIACGIALTTAIAAPGFLHRMATLENLGNLWTARGEGVDSSSRSRATLTIATAKVFLDHPVLGVGAGQSRYYMARYSNDSGFNRIEGTKRSHNMYLEELANTGILGFAAFMSIVLVVLKQLSRLCRALEPRNYEYACMASGLFFSILTYLCTALFLHLSYERYYWILLALAGAAIQSLRLAEKQAVTIEG